MRRAALVVVLVAVGCTPTVILGSLSADLARSCPTCDFGSPSPLDAGDFGSLPDGDFGSGDLGSLVDLAQ